MFTSPRHLTAAGSISRSLTWWTLAGAALLNLLFMGSVAFTESITAGKHPEYADYQRAVPRLIPRPPRG